MNLPFEICAIISDYFGLGIIITTTNPFQRLLSFPSRRTVLGHDDVYYYVEHCFDVGISFKMEVWLAISYTPEVEILFLSLDKWSDFSQEGRALVVSRELLNHGISTVNEAVKKLPVLIQGFEHTNGKNPLQLIK